jgi:phosphoketolase
MRIAAMIFLKDNVLVERDLRAEDIKPRLLGTLKRRNAFEFITDKSHE